MQSKFRLSLTGFVVSAATTSLLIINSIVPYGANSNKAYGAGLDNFACSGSGSYYNNPGSNNTSCGNDAFPSNDTGNYNTAIGFATLFYNNTGNDNTGVGDYALHQNYAGSDNTAIGFNALASTNVLGTVSFNDNTAIGANTLFNNSTGNDNTASGFDALYRNTTGSYNTAIGEYALNNNTTGSYNIAIGILAGTSLTTGSYSNVDIANSGVTGESGTIRIGASINQNRTFIAGITGVNIPGGSAVYVNSSGQLGISSSSRRFKTDIQELGDPSQKLLTLRPVSFRYKQADDKGGHPLQYGLIAEEVAEVFPQLVQYDKEGKPFTVYYHELTPLLLAEVQKEHEKVVAQQSEIASLKQQLVAQKQQQATRIAAVELKLNQLDHLIQANK